MFFLGRVESGLPWVRKMGPETAVPSAAAVEIRVNRDGAASGLAVFSLESQITKIHLGSDLFLLY